MTSVASPRTSPSASSSGEQLGQRAALVALVRLGQAAGQARRPVAEHREGVAQRSGQAARRLEGDEGRGVAASDLARQIAGAPRRHAAGTR